MKHFTFLLAFYLIPSFAQAQVRINELLASNAITIADPDFQEYGDWIELYNAGPAPMDLTGWRLSDDNDIPDKWVFPAGTTIAPGAFLIVWADGTGGGLHTGFKLSADGEKVILSEASGSEIDRVEFPAQQTDISFGRSQDGAGVWGYLGHPTPGSGNAASAFYDGFVVNVPVFSISGGFYDAAVSVQVENLGGKGVLHYTVNGAVPGANDPVWAGPLQLTANTVVKARIFESGKLPGPVVTNTYFIGENFKQRGIAVMSLSTHPDYFFAVDSGIYVQNFKPEWEIPLHLEFYEPDGVLGFHHDAGAGIGGENAWILPEKMLNIFSRKQYGSNKIIYQLFPNNPRNEFEDIILRCSGNDWSNTLFRDGMEQGLAASNSDHLDIQDFRPCAVYINGKYYGIHNIREKQDKEYTAIYHGIDADSLDYIENNGEVKEGNIVAYQQMVDMLNAGIADDAAFADFEQLCDTRNYTDYMISQIFTANTSWGHNIALFRKRAPGAKWRWLPHDYDRGFDLANVGSTAMSWATATNGQDWTNPAWGTLFLRKMLENNAFKERFITRFADHLFVTYNPSAINKRVDKHAAWIRNEIPYHVERWQGATSSYGDAIPSVAFWENEVNKLKTFGVQRNAYMFNDISQYFSLAGSTGLQVEVTPADRGRVRLHDIEIPQFPWSGSYLKNRPFVLHAEAKPGFNFVHWERLALNAVPIVEPGAEWKYRDADTAPPSDWFAPNFDDSSWASGAAELGYGDGDEATTLQFGSNSNNKTISYYFRKSFEVSDPAAVGALAAKMVADDGAVVYLNGQEVWRHNMPTGAIAFTTLASTTVNAGAESAWNEKALSASLLPGTNVLAVEIHQVATSSSDISFNFQLQGTSAGNVEVLGTNPDLEYTLGDNPVTLRAVFESDGSCGILPDTVRENTTLPASCSPYRAAGNVVVLPNVRLTVEAGVEIQFPENADLVVHGDMQIQGLQNAPVRIKAAAGADAWGAILLENTTAPCNFQYLVVEQASAGSQRLYFPAAISAYHSDLTLDHLTITDVHDNPVFARFSNVTLLNSNLKSSVTGDCINIKNGYGRVENCTFTTGAAQPDMDAIDYDGVAGGVVRYNVIHDFRGDNNDGLDIGEECHDLQIEHNIIFHCLDKGISVGQRSSAAISNNLIAYTGYGIALKDQSPVTIDHCTFYGNRQAVAAYEKNPGNLGGNGLVTNCIASNIAFGSFVSDAFSSITVQNTLTDTDTLGGNNLQANPLFVDPTWYRFQFQLGSPAIQAGSDGLNLGLNPVPGFLIQPQLMFSEIMYDDSLSATGEFVELLNPGDLPIDLSGYVLANALDFVFPAGAVIAPGERVVIAKDATLFNSPAYQVFEWTVGKLADEGEMLELYDASGLLVDFVRYDNHEPWPERSSLQGKSLELVSEHLDNHFASSWKPSNSAGGSPGGVSPVSNTVEAGSLRLNIYPNPVSSESALLALQCELAGIDHICITDACGRLICEQTLSAAGAVRMPAHTMPGLYLVTVVDKEGNIFGREKLMVH